MGSRRDLSRAVRYTGLDATKNNHKQASVLLSVLRNSKHRRRALLAVAAVLSIGMSGLVGASGWAPFTAEDSATVIRGGSVSVLDTGATSVLANDFDFERDPLTAELTREPRRGSVQLNEDGTFVYRHDGSRQDDDEFRYRALDGTGRSRNTRVRIRVEDRPNNPPFVTGQPPDQVAVEDTPFRLALAGYFGDLDDDDSLRFSMGGLPGRFAIGADTGVLAGTPSRNDARDTPYTVRITATDEGGLSASLEFRMTIRRDDRPDLKVTSTVATNPVTVGESLAWRIDIENLGSRSLGQGELVVQWVTSGPALSITPPASGEQHFGAVDVLPARRTGRSVDPAAGYPGRPGRGRGQLDDRGRARR